MRLPLPIHRQIEALLDTKVRQSIPVSGGCISQTARVQLGDGQQVFLKWNDGEHAVPGFFEAEAQSLRALAETGAVRVPEVLQTSENFLMLEWLEPGASSKEGWRALGQGLAALHRHSSEGFGWPAANFIGSLPQSNNRHQAWAEFWRTERLRPQIELAHAAERFKAAESRQLMHVLERIETLLEGAAAEPASLLHGDLWSGNVHMMSDGGAALIDPSSYYGHREVDLAMTHLFGGFDSEFYEAYDEVWPLTEGAGRRRLVYQLYYVLVHVNLFGGAYVKSALDLAARLS